jgi:uncharacterized protein (TIGR03067 family)
VRAFVVGIVAVVVLIAANAPKDEAAKKELDGTWSVMSSESDGRKASKDDIKMVRLVFAGATLTTKRGDKSAESAIVIRPGEKPKEIDVIPGDGPDKGKKLQGIYELNGDNLRICLSKPGKKRPTEFTSQADSGRVLIVLNRTK